MKPLLAFIFLLPSLVNYAQVIDKDQKDDFTKTRIVTTKQFSGSTLRKDDYIDTNNSLVISAVYSKDDKGAILYAINIGIVVKGINYGCLSEYNGKMIILLENDSTIEAKQFSTTNCDSNYLPAQYLPLSEADHNNPVWSELVLENIELLSSKKVKKIRVYATEGYNDFELKPEKQDVLIRHLTLIKSRL
ncbi:MAG: hypothetical protein WAZ98_03725 [Cyclobacteriaceae bacterium]